MTGYFFAKTAEQTSENVQTKKANGNIVIRELYRSGPYTVNATAQNNRTTIEWEILFFLFASFTALLIL